MLTFHKDSEYRILFLIAVPKVVVKAAHLLEEEKLPVHYQFFAQGTASSRIMDLLGLGGVDKLVLCALAPEPFAKRILGLMRERLQLKKPNSGVAFTVSLTAGTAGLMRLVDPLKPDGETMQNERMGEMMKEQEYSMIVALVNQGFSEDVMKAANRAGAKGGTVFHCRRTGSEEAARFWGITIQQEREVVMILAPRAEKAGIMEAVNADCGVQSEAQGMVFSLPVDDIAGLAPAGGA